MATIAINAREDGGWLVTCSHQHDCVRQRTVSVWIRYVMAIRDLSDQIESAPAGLPHIPSFYFKHLKLRLTQVY